ncbi:MAG: hypothetical protein IH595_00195 [Bacteroidales bacterium]|nr:hypothetical protein [Bacteroidales bacterium]
MNTMKKFYLLAFVLLFSFSGFQLTAANSSQKESKKSVKIVALKFNTADQLANISWEMIHHFFDGTAPEENIEIKIQYTGSNHPKDASKQSFSIDSKGKMSGIDGMISDLKKTITSLQEFVKK